jgi:hypothetical protein
MEHSAGKGSRSARIVAVDGGTRFVRRHLRRYDDGGFCIEERHTIGDGSYVPVDERHQTPRSDQHLFARRRLPEDLAIKRSGPHVKPPVVTQQVCIGQPEGLVIHKELGDLAISHVADGLSHLCEAVSLFPVYDRMGLIESVDQCAVFSIGPAFLRAPAHSEISVAEGRHRFQLGKELRVEPLFNDVPFIGGVVMRWWSEPLVMEHRAIPPMRAGFGQSTSSARSCSTNGILFGFIRRTDWLVSLASPRSATAHSLEDRS